VLYRRPFEGASARRYARHERPAFGDLDRRLLERLALAGSETVLDLGFGPGTFGALACSRHPRLRVIAIDPSRDFARCHADLAVVRAAGEALPVRDAAVDLAVCLSSLRHVRDRSAVLAELRRVVRPGGRLLIVELDPASDRARIDAHAGRLGSTVLRHAFRPLVVRTAPAAAAIETLALAAGWRRLALDADPVQPVYVMELA
jgi:ubiquinone/menaquinone biosynthesis C-methylase UbiE